MALNLTETHLARAPIGNFEAVEGQMVWEVGCKGVLCPDDAISSRTLALMRYTSTMGVDS